MLEIVYRPVGELVPYARNARTHSDEQVDQLAASIAEFGFTNPILLAPDGTIIAGHGRLAAARKRGLAEVPTITLADLTEAQRKALVIADNQLALNAGWDLDTLKLELGDLDAEGFDLGLLGFDDGFLDGLLAQDVAGRTDPDAAPELPARPVSRLGDLWILGPHRLLCGDCTDPGAVVGVLDGVAPNLMVTDPPYGVSYEPGLRDRADRALGAKTTSRRATGQVRHDDRADWSEAWGLFPGQIAYVWHGMKAAGTVFRSLEESGFEVRAEVVWTKSRPAIGWGRYSAQHESCFYAVRGRLPKFKGASESTVWEVDHLKNDTGHGTQKPVELMKRAIEHSSSPGQAVYEPFSGSGTTIMACEVSGRLCHALEIEPAYVDVAVERWEAFTGRQAHHAVTLDSFAATRAQRQEIAP